MLNTIAKKLHHYLIPHESNNYRARSLHNSAIILYLVVLVSFQFGRSILQKLNPDVLGYATDISVSKVLELVNQKRLEANLAPLTLSNELSQAATAKANDMYGKNYWAHISPTGATPWVFINNAGYQYLYAGENLARNFNTSREVVDAWMSSPTHRANILKSEYKDIGLAVVNGRLNGEETTLVVEEFGTRTAPIADAKPPIIPATAIAQAQNQLAGTTTADNQQKIEAKNSFNISFTSSKSLSLLLTEFLLVVLFADSIYLWKTKTARFGSHSLAHIIFLVALIGAMGATGMGVIL